MKVHSTKAFLNMPCAHAQWFDKEPDGSPGDCASLHGYDRSVKFTFSGDVDDMGWLVPFGELGKVKKFLEYYFDHTSVIPGNDPRIPSIPDELTEPGGILGTLRILPYGVSMEMSSLFIWEHVNPYIYQVTSGRAYVSRVESIEHERNAAFVEVKRKRAERQAEFYIGTGAPLLPEERFWASKAPQTILNQINGLV